MNHSANNAQLEEKILASERVFEGKVVKLDLVNVTLPDGQIAQREVIRHVGAVAIVPVDEHGNVTLVRQYRTALHRVLMEIPAGKLDGKQEDHLEAARRELKEETGLVAGSMVRLTDMVSTPGFCDENISIYLATNLTQHEDSPDEDEFLSVERLPLARLLEMAQAGQLEDAKTLVGILLAARKLRV